MKLVSTTSLSKLLGISTINLFALLLKYGFVAKNGKSWVLTQKGEANGGKYKESKQYGKYITWPENIALPISDVKQSAAQVKMLTATAIGRSFELSANKINFIFSKLGWLNKGIKGWMLTEQGKSQGGLQIKDKNSGIPFVRWPDNIVNSKSLKETIGRVNDTEGGYPAESQNNESSELGFREKFKAKHRTTDGHFVRSKAEMIIDNWLYMAGIVHAYERKLPIEEDVYSDFYIPAGKVYIEYWGNENDSKYLARKNSKLELYKKYDFNLIELQDKEVQNLDDILPRLLLKYGVQTY